jgi:hypothetical protein
MDTIRLISISILLTAITGCGSPLFRADFDSDTLGDSPSASPPGSPVGDFIYLSAPGTIPGPAVVVSDSAFAGRSLRYRNSDVELWYRFVGFMSKEITSASEQYWAAWNGRPNLPNSASALDIWFGNAHFLPMALLRFDNGQVRLQTSTGASPSFETLGTYASGTVHTVLMKIDKLAGTYVITIFASGGNITTGVRPVLNSSALGTLRPTVYMFFSDDVSSSGTYTVDNVLITEACPLDEPDVFTHGSCEGT